MAIHLDIQLVQTGVLFFGAIFLMGFAVDVWLKSKHVVLYPAYGLLIFSALGSLITYLLGHYSTLGLTLLFLGILGLGVVGVFRHGVPVHLAQFRNGGTLISFAGGVAFLAFAFIQASKYGLPGGVDSSIHSGIINGILIQLHSVAGTYPLGMHTVVLFFERFLHASQAHVFLALYSSLHLLCLVGIGYIAKQLFHERLASLVAIVAAIIDVSMYNNFLNGSGTHLFGIFLIIALVSVVIVVQHLPRLIKVASLVVVFTAIWYLHYPTLFFALPVVWAWHLARSERPTWQVLGAFGLSFVVSLPMQLRFLSDSIYLHSIIPGLAVIATTGIFLHFAPRGFFEIFKRRWFILLVALLAIVLFYSNLSNFLYLPTWYGQLSIYLAFLGIGVALVAPSPSRVFGLFTFAVMTGTYALFNHNFAPGQSKVMVELIYYYGFAFSLVLLGASGLQGLHSWFRHSKVRHIFVTLLVLYSLLLLYSRAFDQAFVRTIFKADQPISRYGTSKGFSILYTKNDLVLAEWVKKNVLNDGVIYNPGGLYNQWASLTEHRIVLVNYNSSTIGDASAVIASAAELFQGAPNPKLSDFISANVKYILLPEGFQTSVYHAQVSLLKRIGNARLYEVLDEQVSGEWIRLSLNPKLTSGELKTVGKATIVCRYCGDNFYFTDKETLQAIALKPGESVTLELASQPISRTFDLYVDSSGKRVALRWAGGLWLDAKEEKVGTDLNVPSNTRVKFQIRNSETEEIHINALALQKRVKLTL